LFAWCTATSAAEKAVAIDLPAGTLAGSLDALATQTHQQVLYPSELVAGRKARALRGAFTLEEALGRLLAGSGVTATRTEGGVLILRAAQAPASRPENSSREDQEPPQNELEEPRLSSVEDPPSAAPLATWPSLVDELTVVGSLIRGQTETPSPVLIFDRAQIERSGYTTVAAALAALPSTKA